MAIVKDEEQQQGQGTSQALGQGMAGQPQQPQEQEQPQQGSSAPATIGASQPSQPSMPMPKQPKAGTGTFANLKSYLQAAQGGGQQKVAQAATQQVQKLGAGAQKGTQQAQQAFGRQMEAGSLKGMATAAEEAKGIVGAARGVTYQAPATQPAAQPQVTAQAEGQAPAAPQPAAPAPAQPQQYFTPEQTQRFAEIINARYQGPASLQQAGLYEQAAQKARTAQEAAQKTQTALGREQLLKDVFGRTRDYGRGVSKLDALLLNTSQQGVKQLQEQAQPAAQAQEALQTAQNVSANEAAQRQAAIEGIRSGARQEFTGARTAEEQATEKRIDDLTKTPVLDEKGQPQLKADGTPMTEWDRLPEFFRQSLANKAASAKTIKSETETQIQQQFAPQAKIEQDISSAQRAKAELTNQLKRLSISPLGSLAGGRRESPVQEENRKRNKEAVAKQLEQVNNSLSQLTAATQSPEFQDYTKAKASLASMNQNQWALSAEEAAVLGVGAGEGLYNIRPEDIRTAEAERGRLITKDELSRQLALQQLAGADVSRELQKDLMYSDLEKAGTQDLSKSLDVESFRRLLDESQAGFKTAAEGANITGTGSKKVSRGNITGKKTKTYTASVGGNVADMLRQAGYDVGAEGAEGVKSLLSDKDLLNRYLGATSTSRDAEGNTGFSALEGGAAGAGTGASIGAMTGTGPVGIGIGAAIGAGVGSMIGGNTVDPLQRYSDLAKEMEEKLGIKGLGAAGQAVQDVRSGAGNIISGAGNIAGKNIVGDVFRGIGGAVGGINTGAMKAYGDAIAKQGAIKDLQKKYAQFLQGQGFENRANIVDTESTRARTAALQNLLRRQG
jgi:hypothetical protein